MDNAKVVQVIKTIMKKGNGTEDNPYHNVIQYWDFEGNLIATKDLVINPTEITKRYYNGKERY